MTHPTGPLVIVDISDDAFNALGDYARNHDNDLSGAGELLAGLSPDQAMALLNLEPLDGVHYQPRLKRHSEKNLSQEEANAVYDLLVNQGGAQERERYAFISHYVVGKTLSREYRFQGHFGFGGKFRYPDSNEYYYVDNYREDETDDTRAAIHHINYQLMRLYAQHRLPTLNDSYSDDDLIGYCDLHCETQRALFHVHHVNRMLVLAGHPDGFVHSVSLSEEFIAVHEPMKQLVALARARLAQTPSEPATPSPTC